MPKLPDDIKDWTAPWETATGETEIDKDKLKRYLFALLGDKQKLQESVAAVTTERDGLKQAAEDKAREGETETQRLQRELKEVQDKLAAKPAGGADDLETMKLRVALNKGLKEGDVKRLIGATEAELLADADELLKSFGQGGKTDDEEVDPNDLDAVAEAARRTPRGRHNPGDPNPGAGAEVDVDKGLESIPRVR
jgi:hypothetical protein